MTNADKYLKDGVSVEEFRNAVFSSSYVDTFETYKYIGNSSLYCFLKEHAKPTLTEDERVILRNLENTYKYITRKEQGLSIYEKEPLIGNRVGINTYLPYDHLFQFIKERRRI